MHGPTGLDGNIVPANELSDRAVQGYASGVSFASSFGAKFLGALTRPRNYSSYANKANWSRDVGRQAKTEQMRTAIFKADQNSTAVRDIDISKSILDGIIQGTQDNPE